MPCEPVGPGVPTTQGRPSSSNVTSSLAFRMKHLGSGSSARRALTSLGTNDTQLNLRLAKSLLTISQEKFAKKWDFDPIREVPLPQGRFYWTPTTAIASTKVAPSGGSTCRVLGTVTSSSGSSHDLAEAEAEDNAAALRTCLNLPTASDTITTPGQPVVPMTSHETPCTSTSDSTTTTGQPVVNMTPQEPRVLSCINTSDITTPGHSVMTMAPQEPRVPSCISTSDIPTPGHSIVAMPRVPPCIITSDTFASSGQPAVTMASQELRVPPCISTSGTITSPGQPVLTTAPQKPRVPPCVNISDTITSPGQPMVSTAPQEPRVPPCIDTSGTSSSPEQHVVTTVTQEPRVPPCISTSGTITSPGQPVLPTASQEPRVPPCISTSGTITSPGQPVLTTASQEPRVPPCINTSDTITSPAQSAPTTAPQEPRIPPCINTSGTISSPGQPVLTMAPQEPRVPPPHPEGAPYKPNTNTATKSNTTAVPSSSGSTSEAIGDAIRGLSTTLVDKERASDAIQDNQCQYIDPTSSPVTDERRQQATPLTQACITNYLRPRKRSSAHLQETVHSPKAKKVLLAA